MQTHSKASNQTGSDNINLENYLTTDLIKDVKSSLSFPSQIHFHIVIGCDHCFFYT